jgi:Tfp pilus assembly protein PilE
MMGQQQLLLIVLSVVIVGIATVVGFQMFADNAAEANMNAVTNDLLSLAGRAQQFYLKPASMGGGGQSFVGLTADSAGIGRLTSSPTNDNGEYSIQTAGTNAQVVIRGVGVEDGDGDGTDVTIDVTVQPDNITTSIVNR